MCVCMHVCVHTFKSHGQLGHGHVGLHAADQDGLPFTGGHAVEVLHESLHVRGVQGDLGDIPTVPLPRDLPGVDLRFVGIVRQERGGSGRAGDARASLHSVDKP